MIKRVSKEDWEPEIDTGRYCTNKAEEMAYSLGDVVECVETGSIGMITEVSINSCQPSVYYQLSYSCRWIESTIPASSIGMRLAWYYQDQIKRVKFS